MLSAEKFSTRVECVAAATRPALGATACSTGLIHFFPFILIRLTPSYSLSAAKRDACGVCGGDNATCAGCDGVPNSGKVYDQCGICGGDGHLCVLDYKLTASRNSFCDGLDLLVQWTAPINHTEFDSVVFFSKTNNSVIDQCVAAGPAVCLFDVAVALSQHVLGLCDAHALSSDISFLVFSIKAISY